MSYPRKICVVTGSRADFGLLVWLMRAIGEDAALTLQVAATGAIDPEELAAGGIVADRRVEMLLASDTGAGVAKSVGLGVIGFADAFSSLAPDIVVVLGDRYEILAAAQAALFLKIPIAHIHGGETTEGALDESIRHAITKMSHLHFVSAEPHRKRVIQLGEHPSRVFDFGAPGLDAIRRLDIPDRARLEEELGFRFGSVNFLVTYHPATLGTIPPAEAAGELLAALDAFPDARVIFTSSNADEGGRAIGALIEAYAARHPSRALAAGSLGQRLYLGAARAVDVVIGNSSSGLIEVPALGTPTVNVGDRQKGRLRGASVFDCREDAAAVREAIGLALRSKGAVTKSPYGDGNASEKIKTVLAEADLSSLRGKPFHEQ